MPSLPTRATMLTPFVLTLPNGTSLPSSPAAQPPGENRPWPDPLQAAQPHRGHVRPPQDQSRYRYTLRPLASSFLGMAHLATARYWLKLSTPPRSCPSRILSLRDALIIGRWDNRQGAADRLDAINIAPNNAMIAWTGGLGRKLFRHHQRHSSFFLGDGSSGASRSRKLVSSPRGFSTIRLDWGDVLRSLTTTSTAACAVSLIERMAERAVSYAPSGATTTGTSRSAGTSRGGDEIPHIWMPREDSNLN